MSLHPELNLKQYIRDIPDFPKPGILFKDITPLLGNSTAFGEAIDRFADRFADSKIDAIVAAEARGFIFAAPLALKLNAAFVPVRKPGKLPFSVHSHEYDLEYGSDTLQMHTDAVQPGQRVLLVDDLLATGGTVEACVKLLNKLEANIVACAFAIHLKFLQGEKRLESLDIYSLLEY